MADAEVRDEEVNPSGDEVLEAAMAQGQQEGADLAADSGQLPGRDGNKTWNMMGKWPRVETNSCM